MKRIYKILIPLLIVAGFICFFEIKGFSERKKFIENKINEPIVEIKNNWTRGRSYDYVTKSKYKITLINSDTLFIGDSISKTSHSSLFEVFRKKNRKYSFYKNYDLNRH